MSVQQGARANRKLWNEGRIVGAKPPLKPQDIWALRTRLQVEKRVRDLAMFNVAIDSKLRVAISFVFVWATSPWGER